MPVKIARSAPRPSFGLPELLVAIHTSRQSRRSPPHWPCGSAPRLARRRRTPSVVVVNATGANDDVYDISFGRKLADITIK
jgi:hypothetical protein